MVQEVQVAVLHGTHELASTLLGSGRSTRSDVCAPARAAAPRHPHSLTLTWQSSIWNACPLMLLQPGTRRLCARGGVCFFAWRPARSVCEIAHPGALTLTSLRNPMNRKSLGSSFCVALFAGSRLMLPLAEPDPGDAAAPFAPVLRLGRTAVTRSSSCAHRTKGPKLLA